LKALAALVGAGVSGTALALAMASPPGVAATGSKVYSTNINLSCVLAPGVLNVAGTVNATLTGTGPETVNTGDTFSLTDVTTSLTTPANWSTSFASLGAETTSGAVTNFVLNAAGATPGSLNAAAALGSGGLPFGPTAITSGQPLNITVPNSGPFTLGPYTVTGAAGGTTELSVDTQPGFTGTKAPYTVTGKGVIANATGYDADGNAVVGPVSIVCNPPTTPVVLGSIPIAGGGTGTDTTPTDTTPTDTTPTDTTPTPPPADTILKFNNWDLTGSVTPRKLAQKITLPAGSTFNGSANLTKQTFTGDIAVPSFTATIKVLGIPSKVKLTFSQAAPASGKIAPDPSNPDNLLVDGTAKANIGISGVGIGGFNIPTQCTTSSPVTFPLKASQPALELTQGVTFTGKTSFPSIRCNGLVGPLLGGALTVLFAGPDNPFSLRIAPHVTT
jgi:hypothetical protein